MQNSLPDFSPDVRRALVVRASSMLSLLANEDRLLLLCALVHEELCVQALEEKLDIRQPTLSQQLGVLRRHGLVATRKEGKFIFYRIANQEALEILQLLYKLYCQTKGA